MPDLEVVLTECFAELSKEYAVERVDYIPNKGERTKATVPVWKITLTANVFGRIEDIEAFIAFPREFPYMLPCVIVPDERFCYLPHISVKTQKLCLYEDGVVYDSDNVYGLIRDCISKTRRWLGLYSNQDNAAEYASEINSYWTEEYEDEKELEPHWIMLGKIPDETCELQGYTYPVDYLGKTDKYFDQYLVCGADCDDGLFNNIKTRHNAYKLPVLFIKSLRIPSEPPFSMTGSQFIECIEEEEDKKRCVKFLDKHLGGRFLFPIGLDFMLGGVTVPKQNVFRKGFRQGFLSATDVLTKHEGRNKKLGRIKAGIYEENRMAKRTAGQLMKPQNYHIVGLGSVGSNLCYYLNGYNNAKFVLIDPDSLTVDNIGRHLLGFNYIDQQKASAVAEYLTLYRPDRKVDAIAKYLEELSTEQINKASTIFLCTGDVMSEKWLLEKLRRKELSVPSFILWLEPYGVSGIMIYVNPCEEDTINRLSVAAMDSFLSYCLIDHTEYESGKKLIQRDAGCNGSYALYSANDVTLFLSAMFQHIDRLLEKPSSSKVYRWVGNIEIATQKGIQLVADAVGLGKNNVQELPL